MSRPLVLSPATPTELFNYILAHHTYPTTLLICWPREPFFDALIQDVEHQLPPLADKEHNEPSPSHGHSLLRAPLMQVAVSRHIHIAFLPTLAHLRSYLAAFSCRDASTQPPPPRVSSTEHDARQAPMLVAYGFLEMHRDTSAWSAQGLNTSAAGLVQAAARNGLRATIIEPRKTESPHELDASLNESVPLLNGNVMKDDGTWPGRVVPIRRVLDRWFVVDAYNDLSIKPG